MQARHLLLSLTCALALAACGDKPAEAPAASPAPAAPAAAPAPAPVAAEPEIALTARETDVLRVIGRGLTIPETAHALEIGAHTVSTHVKNIYRKLNIASRAEAAIEASRRGLV